MAHDNLNSKQLSSYLPYSLKVIMEGEKCNVAWMSTKHIAVIRPYGIGEYKTIRWVYAHLNIKPILRPLSDLKLTEFEMEDWRKNAILFLDETANLPYNSRISHIGGIMYGDISKLFEWKFDVFGLIEKGLAIDVNQIK